MGLLYSSQNLYIYVYQGRMLFQGGPQKQPELGPGYPAVAIMPMIGVRLAVGHEKIVSPL